MTFSKNYVILLSHNKLKSYSQALYTFKYLIKKVMQSAIN